MLIWLGGTGQVAGYLNPYSDYATEVVEYSGQFGPSPYDEPNAILGKPATDFIDPGGMSGEDPERTAKLVEAVYNVDATGNKLITTILPDDYIVVKFDHKVVDYPGNLYGADFIVFGNSVFLGAGFVNQSTNMNTYLLTSGGIFEAVRVSVSQDAQIWYSYDSGPWADNLFPTQAYLWDRDNAQWTDQEMDFTRPVDPNLSFSDFAGLAAADAIDHYNGSGGGTPFDLKNLTDYDNLAVDPNSGYRWIQYVRFDGVDSPQGAEIDAVSDVAACGDPTHPHLPGDVNLDCRVDLVDFSMMAENWLECTYQCE
ncbi:MAG: hypothetical protein ACYS8S_06100 [Planctomycetota bacterium]|jgi:hypothetical protein